MRTIRAASIFTAALLSSISLTGCLVVGYSGGNGWYVWPGSLIITLVLVLVYFLTRR